VEIIQPLVNYFFYFLQTLKASTNSPESLHALFNKESAPSVKGINNTKIK
jgi:hypothetical protein